MSVTHEVTLEVRGLHLAYASSATVLRGLDATFAPGLVHVIAGPNGAGKTTLLHALCGLLRPTAGSVQARSVSGAADLCALDPVSRGRLIAAHLELPRDALGFTVTDLVAMGRHGLTGEGAEVNARAVAAALDHFELGPVAPRQVSQLSTGQQQRTSLARTWVRDTPIVLLDEPASHLDLRHTVALAAAMRQAAAAGRTVIAVLHDLTLVARLADRVLLLSDGQALVAGPPAEVLTPTAIRAVWGVEAVVGAHGGELTIDVRGLSRAAP